MCRFGLRVLARLRTAAVVVMLGAAPAWAQSASEQPAAFRLGGIAFLDDGPDMLGLGVGAFNVIPNDRGEDMAAELRLEYRLGEKWLAIGPMIGALATTEGGVFGYAALYTDIRLGQRWLVTPAAGIGAYRRGDGKDLGGVFQFHLAVDAAYQFESGDRLGLKLAHISNAGVNDENPGAESVLLTYTISLGFPWRP